MCPRGPRAQAARNGLHFIQTCQKYNRQQINQLHFSIFWALIWIQRDEPDSDLISDMAQYGLKHYLFNDFHYFVLHFFCGGEEGHILVYIYIYIYIYIDWLIDWLIWIASGIENLKNENEEMKMETWRLRWTCKEC